MSLITIRVNNLSKQYRIGERLSYKTFREAIVNIAKAPFRKRNGFGSQTEFRNSESDTIWALKDVSFEVKQGEVVGIIGRNGAGKSTLLKILSKITEPKEGRVEIKGRVGSLLEVGTGFHPELTGHENIYLYGAILGMDRWEVSRKFDEIVAFAELEKFIDTPVKRYSSGMYMRLAFAVAAHLETEILLVDEVLAVGDAEFQKRCLGKMGEISKEGRTVLFVSHNMGAIRALCSRAILFEQGQVVMDDDPQLVISAYLSSGILEETEGQIKWRDDESAPNGDELKLRSIRLKGPDGRICSTFEVDKSIKVEICYELKTAVHGMRISLYLFTLQGETAFATTDHNMRKGIEQPGCYTTTCTIPGGLLNIGKYIVNISSCIPAVKTILPLKEYLGFSTVGSGNHGSNYPESWPGVVCPKLQWQIFNNNKRIDLEL